MRPFSRSERVAGHVQKTLSDILTRTIRDPRLHMTTITGVKMSADLKIARVYFISPRGKRGGLEALAGFRCAAGFVKRTLARRLGLRYMPDLQFYYDESFDYGSHIDSILRTLKEKNGPDHTPSENC